MATIREAMRVWALKPTKKERRLQALKDAENKQKAAEESYTVRNLRKALALQEEMTEKAYVTIRQQQETIDNHKSGDWQEKLVDKGLDMLPFLFNSPKPPINVTGATKPDNLHPQPLAADQGTKSTEIKQEAAKGLSHEEIKNYVDSIDNKWIPQLTSLEYDKFSQLIKTKIPEATQENILDGYTLLQEKNGK
jgi:hypothetical protein